MGLFSNKSKNCKGCGAAMHYTETGGNDRVDDLMKRSAIVSQITTERDICASCQQLSVDMSDSIYAGHLAMPEFKDFSQDQETIISLEENSYNNEYDRDDTNWENRNYRRGDGYEREKDSSIIWQLIIGYFWPLAVLAWMFKDKKRRIIFFIIIAVLYLPRIFT